MKKTLLTLTLLHYLLIFGFSQQYNSFEFEEDFSVTIDTETDTLWQIGKPAKSFFDEANSLPNAIMTDSLNTYPINQSTWIELTINENTLWSYPFMQIDWDYKLDTEDGVDGGIIEASYDNGQSWKNIFSDPVFRPDIVGDYETDTLFNGQVGITGVADWRWMAICWGSYFGELPEDPNTIKVRFTFVSDSIDTQQDGWMIDNFQTQTQIIGSTSNQSIQPVAVFPNPTRDFLFFDIEEIEEQPLNIEVYDNLGRLVLSKNLDAFREERLSVFVGDLVIGRYMVLLRMEETTLRSSFLKVD